MEQMNAQQAAEWGKTLDFSQVWTALMGISERQAKTDAQMAKTDAQMAKTDAELDRVAQIVAETSKIVAETSKTVAETTKALERTEIVVAETSKTVGGVGNSFGYFMEGMFTARICSKFDAFEHTFTKIANGLILYKDDGGKLCEIDAFLENGDFVMAVEVKTKCEMKDINDHLKRLDKIRGYMNDHNDNRKILGCIAASIISDKLITVAEENGLYVMVQTGEAVEILEKPGKFTEGVW
ncbi:MAG: hypothetical protein LBM77_03560 [Spirochaetaceae bacterium]|jgi:paraquat-inducible protein B|nr:hypothetical protein [Spirochaetaceae bacterium]